MRQLAEIVAELELGRIQQPGDELAQEWTAFLLRYRFQWFATFTFRESVHPENAMKVFRVWLHKLDYYLFGRKATRLGRGVFFVVAHEYQKRGVLHFHALIGSDIDLGERIAWGPELMPWTLLYWQEKWFDMAGICRIEPIKIDEFVSRYVSKYVAKGGQIDVSENLKFHVPGQPGRLDK